MFQDPSTASAAYINCTLGASPRHSVTSPGPGYLNITQERPNTLAMGADTRHEYENVGPDTQAISPGYVPPRWVMDISDDQIYDNYLSSGSLRRWLTILQVLSLL